MNRLALNRLLALLQQPTAPFREALVIRFVEQQLAKAQVPWFRDPAGNLVAGCTPRQYQTLLGTRGHEPLRVLIAHLDHPGFHGLRWHNDRTLEFRWLGGSPVRRLVGAPVWLSNGADWQGEGRIVRAIIAKHGHAIETGLVRLDTPANPLPADALFGGFRFRAPVWQQGKTIYTKAADDLVGVFAILETLRSLRRQRRPVVGLLTRGEEVGFIGAIAHFADGKLQRAKRPVVAVSLETSRTLPGAIIGKGPVVRLGDRRTVFDPAALEVLTQVAQKTLPGHHQRRVMDGGSCEATAATAYGIAAIGLSVPLGNYHNQSLEHGPDSRGPDGPAPEFVHQDDIAGLLTLCRGLTQPGLPWGDPWRQTRKQLQKRLAGYRALLKRRD